MSQTNKNQNSPNHTKKSFLDKFQGKTNKVGRTGMHAVLTGSQDVNKKQQDNKANNEKQIQHQFRKVDLDALIPSNPERQSNKNNSKLNVDMIVKRRQSLKPGNKSMNKQKPQYIPSAYTPQTSSKQQSLSGSSAYPPSRSLSNSTNNSRGKYIFGKYLKLDKQALSHIQFLQSIQEKSLFKRSKGQSLNLQ